MVEIKDASCVECSKSKILAALLGVRRRLVITLPRPVCLGSALEVVLVGVDTSSARRSLILSEENILPCT